MAALRRSRQNWPHAPVCSNESFLLLLFPKLDTFIFDMNFAAAPSLISCRVEVVTLTPHGLGLLHIVSPRSFGLKKNPRNVAF